MGDRTIVQTSLAVEPAMSDAEVIARYQAQKRAFARELEASMSHVGPYEPPTPDVEVRSVTGPWSDDIRALKEQVEQLKTQVATLADLKDQLEKCTTELEKDNDIDLEHLDARKKLEEHLKAVNDELYRRDQAEIGKLKTEVASLQQRIEANATTVLTSSLPTLHFSRDEVEMLIKLEDLRFVANPVQWQQLAQRWIHATGHVPLQWVTDALANDDTLGHAILYFYMVDVQKTTTAIYLAVADKFVAMKDALKKHVVMQNAFAEGNIHGCKPTDTQEDLEQGLEMVLAEAKQTLDEETALFATHGTLCT